MFGQLRQFLLAGFVPCFDCPNLSRMTSLRQGLAKHSRFLTALLLLQPGFDDVIDFCFETKTGKNSIEGLMKGLNDLILQWRKTQMLMTE